MTVKVIALLTIREDEPKALAEYLDRAEPILSRSGARIAARYAVTDTLVGDPTVKTMVVVEYPSREAVRDALESPEYAALKPLRDRAFAHYQISVVDA